MMIKYLKFSELNEGQLVQYRSAVETAFPKIILLSEGINELWLKIEKYFPEVQLFMVDSNNVLMGFMNTIPFFWDQSLKELPNEGWDWLVQKGISDFENNITPNSLGGLQVIVIKNYQGKGLSKMLIAQAKKIVKQSGFDHFIIPIRPTFKMNHPDMEMDEYMKLKKNNQLYDPWIRTHLKSGAKVIQVCTNSMNIKGDIKFWEKLMHRKIKASGYYIVEGALSPVFIEIEKDFGEYKEENIWIYYGKSL